MPSDIPPNQRPLTSGAAVPPDFPPERVDIRREAQDDRIERLKARAERAESELKEVRRERDEWIERASAWNRKNIGFVNEAKALRTELEEVKRTLAVALPVVEAAREVVSFDRDRNWRLRDALAKLDSQEDSNG